MTATSTPTPVTVEHRPQESRYVLIDTALNVEIGQEVYVDVTGVSDDAHATPHRIMYHTEVAQEYGGQGLASRLVEAAVADTIDAGARVVPVCPYVVRWSQQRPELAKHMVTARPEHLNAIPKR